MLMTTYDASVKKALTASQQDLINHKEHCSADPEKLATVGREGGHQVRIKRNDSEYALYTISQVRQERPDNIIRMGSTGRERLGTSDEFVGSLDSQVPHRTSRGRHRAPHRPTGGVRGVATRGQGGELVAVQGL